METQDAIKQVCAELTALLLEKNKSYGDSAINPINVFSKLSAEEQINVRIDDKLSRLLRGHEFKTEDTELDLIGYLILKRVKRLLDNEKKTKDHICRRVSKDKSEASGIILDRQDRKCGLSRGGQRVPGSKTKLGNFDYR